MNCPSRVDPEAVDKGWNQSPGALALHKNNDLNGRANLTKNHDHRIHSVNPPGEELRQEQDGGRRPPKAAVVVHEELRPVPTASSSDGFSSSPPPGAPTSRPGVLARGRRCGDRVFAAAWARVAKFARFVGPGFMIAVAYIDPGNYATDVSAGASFQYKLLVMVLVSNFVAVFLQSLCIKLGSVTGMNLAENIRAHCPRWLNYFLWFFAECAIIATDIAEVLGTAIALNLLIKVPLVAGCAISIVDVLIILIFYRPSGTMKGLRWFEAFVMLLVLGVVVCFCFELSLIQVPNVGELFKGYLPSSALVQSEGLYQACGILGATVMPHSLYLGSGIVQPRLMEYDQEHHNLPARPAPTNDSSGAIDDDDDDDEPALPKYKPSMAAIKFCMSYSIAELSISLCAFALFVNSAILIVAGATLADTPGAADADLFSIHDLFSQTLSPFAGTVFALALLLSGTSAGIICTIAGQMVSEGQIGWTIKPWMRRLITRSISITPSIIVAGAVGKEGVSAALNGSQVALSVILPVVSAPLLYFTCRNKYMAVDDPSAPGGVRKMRNNWFTTAWCIGLWLLIVVMNVALIVLAAEGQS